MRRNGKVIDQNIINEFDKVAKESDLKVKFKFGETVRCYVKRLLVEYQKKNHWPITGEAFIKLEKKWLPIFQDRAIFHYDCLTTCRGS